MLDWRRRKSPEAITARYTKQGQLATHTGTITPATCHRARGHPPPAKLGPSRRRPATAELTAGPGAVTHAFRPSIFGFSFARSPETDMRDCQSQNSECPSMQAGAAAKTRLLKTKAGTAACTVLLPFSSRQTRPQRQPRDGRSSSPPRPCYSYRRPSWPHRWQAHSCPRPRLACWWPPRSSTLPYSSGRVGDSAHQCPSCVTMADGIPEGLPPCGALQPERSVPAAAQEESEPEPEPQPH